MKPLTKLSEAELEQKAAELGVDFTPGALNKRQLISLIEAIPEPVEEVEDREELEAAPAIVFADDPEPAPEPKAKRAKKDDPKTWRYRIVVHNQEGVENTPFVKVGVNGRLIQINREQEVEIGADYMEALNNAVIEMPAIGDNPARKTMRFPVSVIEVIKP